MSLKQGREDTYIQIISSEKDGSQKEGGTRWPRTVRAGDLEIGRKNDSAGFVKLSEEEREKRRQGRRLLQMQ